MKQANKDIGLQCHGTIYPIRKISKEYCAENQRMKIYSLVVGSIDSFIKFGVYVRTKENTIR